MKTNRLSYEELELIPIQKKTEKSLSVKVFSGLKKAWNFVINLLSKEPGIEIKEKCDRQGNTCWYVYDTTTGYSTYFVTEQEVLTWIEGRYHRRNTDRTTYLKTQSWELWLRQKM